MRSERILPKFLESCLVQLRKLKIPNKSKVSTKVENKPVKARPANEEKVSLYFIKKKRLGRKINSVFICQDWKCCPKGKCHSVAAAKRQTRRVWQMPKLFIMQREANEGSRREGFKSRIWLEHNSSKSSHVCLYDSRHAYIKYRLVALLEFVKQEWQTFSFDASFKTEPEINSL